MAVWRRWPRVTLFCRSRECAVVHDCVGGAQDVGTVLDACVGRAVNVFVDRSASACAQRVLAQRTYLVLTRIAHGCLIPPLRMHTMHPSNETRAHTYTTSSSSPSSSEMKALREGRVILSSPTALAWVTASAFALAWLPDVWAPPCCALRSSNRCALRGFPRLADVLAVVGRRLAVRAPREGAAATVDRFRAPAAFAVAPTRGRADFGRDFVRRRGPLVVPSRVAGCGRDRGVSRCAVSSTVVPWSSSADAVT